MQKFTRSLTREIEVAGERLAVTFSLDGLTVRPVGSRRPPATLSWAGCICASVGQAVGGGEPAPEAVAAALASLKTGGKKEPSRAAAPSSEAAQPAAPAPPSELASLLARLDHLIAERRPRFVKALAPPATAAQLADAERLLGAALPEDLCTLLSWHNGQTADVVGALEGSFHLLSAAQIAELKKKVDASPPPGWQTGWVPFLDDGSESYVCLDRGQVREVWRGRGEHPGVADSLAAWVGRFVQALAADAYFEDSERGTFSRRST